MTRNELYTEISRSIESMSLDELEETYNKSLLRHFVRNELWEDQVNSIITKMNLRKKVIQKEI